MASRWDRRPRLTSLVMMGLKKAFLRLLSSLAWPGAGGAPVVVRVGMSVVMAVFDRHGRGQHQASGLDPLGADQAVGQLADDARPAAQEDDLQATVGVEVDVGRRHHPFEVLVL